MAMVRRLLIAVVGLLLILDAGALAYIKFTSGPAPSDEKSKLVLWIDKEDQAKGAAAAFKAQGYEAIVKPDKRKDTVEADFRVAMQSSKKELLEPIAQILTQAGHKGLSYSEDGLTLYYGGYYKQKAEATRVTERIRNQDKIGFEVLAGSKVVGKPSFKVILLEVPSNMVEDLLSGLDDKYEIADQSETPVAKPKPSAETEEE